MPVNKPIESPYDSTMQERTQRLEEFLASLMHYSMEQYEDHPEVHPLIFGRMPHFWKDRGTVVCANGHVEARYVSHQGRNLCPRCLQVCYLAPPSMNQVRLAGILAGTFTESTLVDMAMRMADPDYEINQETDEQLSRRLGPHRKGGEG